jgi:hypothetical protein
VGETKRGALHLRQRSFGPRPTAGLVSDPHQGHICARRGQDGKGIFQVRNAGPPKGVADMLGTFAPVMIAQNGIHTQRRTQCAEMGDNGLNRHMVAARHAGDHIIAGEQDQIRLGLIGHRHDPVDLGGVDIRRPRMQVADHRDPQSLQQG